MKKFLAITSLLLVFLMLTLTGCGNPYAGNYKEATEEQKQATVTKLEALINSEEKVNMKMTGEIEFKMEGEQDGQKGSASITSETVEIYDYSVKGEFKAYCKISYKAESSASGNGQKQSRSYEYSVEEWIDEAASKAYANYVVKRDGQTVAEGKGSFEVPDMSAVTSLFDNSDSSFTLNNVLDATHVYVVYIDGDKVKIENADAGVTYYVIFESETSYRARKEMTVDMGYGAFVPKEMIKKSSAVAEIVPTKDTVSMPTDEGYAAAFDYMKMLSDITSVGM